ncbi:3'-5' exonuclease [Corynebacterium timonense]|uniref:DNA polymerase III, epsilon subunit n=1 Tax=Corynebacterium timonense TaxID=441500 RepID=A0A1H1RZR2_9CORY|nr:3'-5' exonuclease [Corynebacterium timonense]SDS41244.1 DNA polymerase III, epsilon subunit [Corynebacterium timonense]
MTPAAGATARSPHPGYVVVAIETTGFSAADRIVEVGVVQLDPSLRVEEEWDTLVDPGKAIPNTFVHGIAENDTAGAPAFGRVADTVGRMLDGRVPVAHNASFTKRFLFQEFRRAGVDSNLNEQAWIDTRDVAGAHLNLEEDSREAALAAAGVSTPRAHVALLEARATAELFRALTVTFGRTHFAKPVSIARPDRGAGEQGTGAPRLSRTQAAASPTDDVSGGIDIDGDIYAHEYDDAEVVAGWAELTGVRFPKASPRALDALFAACVQELVRSTTGDARLYAIAERRWLGTATLEELGHAYGVTRERIRQLENALRKTFDGLDVLSSAVAEQIERHIGWLAPASRLEARFPALAHRCDGLAGTYEEYFRGLYGRWERSGEWVYRAGFAEHFASSMDRCVDQYGVVDVERLAGLLESSTDDAVRLLEQRPEVAALNGGALFARAKSHQDRAVAILSVEQRPLPAAELAERAGTPDSVRSMANQLAVDERIARVSNGTYALAEWGMEEYSTIVDWIARRIDESEDGSVELSTLLAEAPQRNISESSVRTYVGGVDFTLVDGTVTRSHTRDELLEGDPQEAKHLYKRDGVWQLLVTVTRDHLRGSGFLLPRAVAALYNARVDGETQVPSRLGPYTIRVNRLRQASGSTIRRFLEELGVQLGDRVWLTFEPERFDVTAAPPHDDTLGGLAGLLSSMGLDPDLAADPDAALGRINQALGLEASAPRRRTTAVFRHRYQDEWADIVRAL